MGKRKKEKDRIECRRLNIDLETLEFQRFNFARDKQFERCARGKQSKRKYMGENTRRQAFLRDLVCKYTFWSANKLSNAWVGIGAPEHRQARRVEGSAVRKK